MERSTRLELALRAWKALVLPLHHDRPDYFNKSYISAFLASEKTDIDHMVIKLKYRFYNQPPIFSSISVLITVMP